MTPPQIEPAQDHPAQQAAIRRPAGTPPDAGEAPHAFDAVLDAERDILRDLFPMPAARPKRRLARTGAAIAAVLAVATAALLWIDPAWRTERHATAIGERRDVLLADGSTLTLDTATALDVGWHLRGRRVALRQGRARFAVTHSALRPFEVVSAGTRVRVVGTVFDVQRHHDGVLVTVLQGLVDVHGATAVRRLTAGQQWRVGGGAPAAPRTVDLSQAGAWQQGHFVFDRTPLREALVEIQRYRPAPIRLRDDGRLGTHAISGVFETGRTDQLLDLLPRIAPAKVQRHADGSVDISPSRP